MTTGLAIYAVALVALAIVAAHLLRRRDRQMRQQMDRDHALLLDKLRRFTGGFEDE